MLKRLIFLATVLLVEKTEASRVGGGNLTTCGCPQRVYPSSIVIPSSYDLRQAFPSTLSPIRNQGECGCCWAFATTSVLADRFAIAAYKLNRTVRRLLSTQTMLDCSTGCLSGGQCNMGCNGGYNTLAIEYFNRTGVVGESCRPYQAAQQVCPAVRCAAGVSSQVYHSSMCYSLETVEDMQRDIMLHGPIVAGLQIFQGFESYTGGIFTVTSQATSGGHAVRLIGWGEENGVQYWIGANQWTTWWGEKGYFRIRRGTSEATIENYVIAMEPSLNLLTKDENVDYMSTCGDCITQRQQPNSDPINSFIPDTGIEWPLGLNDTSAISLIILAACGLFACLGSAYYYCLKPKRQKQQIDQDDRDLQRAIEESKRNHSVVAQAPPPIIGRDPDLELALALSQKSAPPIRLSVPAPAAVVYSHRPSAPPDPQQIAIPVAADNPQFARLRAASRPVREDNELKQALALSQQNLRADAQRRMTKEEADIQLAIQLSQAEASPPAYVQPHRQEDDVILI